MIESITGQDARWISITTRDVSADGRFVYAVTTTRVYCRPSCPSRTAKRENVYFYATPAEAEAAGFRACRRCNPNGPSLAKAKAAAVAEACRLIETADELPKLSDLAAHAGLSASYFHRQFKAVTGLTPKQWAAAQRKRRVRAELANQGESVTQAIYGAGFK